MITGTILTGRTADFGVTKLRSSGVPDATFHAGGLTRYGGSFDPGDVNAARAVVVAPDGDRFVAGFTNTHPPEAVEVVAVLPNGYRDTRFGEVGTGEIPSPLDGSGRAVAVASGNRPVVAGCANCSQSARNFAVLRWTAAGTLDATFDGDGVATTSFGSTTDAIANGVAIASDGKVVAGGSAGSRMAVARYKTGGGLDQTFSGDGKQTIAFTGLSVTADAVAIQGDGKIVLAGTLFNQAGESFAVARLNADGTLDQGFGTGGRVTTTFAAGPAEASSMVIRSDGRIIVAGTAVDIGRTAGRDRALPRQRPPRLEPRRRWPARGRSRARHGHRRRGRGRRREEDRRDRHDLG